MAVFDNRHSRIVAWLKVVLPLSALAILSTLFLLADGQGSDSDLPYSQIEIDRILSEQRIANPNYTTVTENGTALSLSAADVRPDQAGTGMRATGVTGLIEVPQGNRIDVSSRTALSDDGRMVALSGDVAIRSTAGYELQSELLELDMDTARASSPGPVSGMGPLGRIDAGRMELAETDGQYLLNFQGGVKVIYEPEE